MLVQIIYVELYVDDGKYGFESFIVGDGLTNNIFN